MISNLIKFPIINFFVKFTTYFSFEFEWKNIDYQHWQMRQNVLKLDILDKLIALT